MSHQAPVIFNGRYELHRRLGRGGMAEVYLARDQMLDRPVAVKVLFPALATDPGFVERFRREAQSAAALNHPNIVSVYDWGEANGTYFIVMEYVEGESLAELIHTEGRLHPDRAAEIASDIAAALGYAHRNGGMVHRDVKPGNVLLTREGDVKVADFGIARAISDQSDANLTKTGSVMGTATYFSPEQARGANVDPRSDVYSLGCVLYEMITGRPPFAGENAVAIAYKHVQEAPVAPRRVDPALPETLEAIILKCLAKNPDNRYPTAQDLRADLRRYLEGARIMAEPVLAPPVDPGATGVMAPTGYNMQPTSAQQWDDGYGGYGDEYDDYQEDEPKRSKAFLVMLVLLLLVLAGLLFLVARALSDNNEDANPVSVPGVVDMEQAQAEQALRDANLEPKVETQETTNQREIGIVLDQDPPEGREVDEGSTVTIKVGASPEQVQVPDLRNKTREEALSLLEEAGLTPNFQEEANPDVEEGRVIRTDPVEGTPVARDSTVNVFISEGPGNVAVPNVKGMTPDEARSAIEGAGLQVGQQTEEASDDVEAGRVSSTDPGIGTEVPEGATINIHVSSGAEEVDIPYVEGLSEDNARGQLDAAGFTVRVDYEDVDDESQDGQVISQQPQGSAPRGTEVRLIVGRFRGGGSTITLPGGGD